MNTFDTIPPERLTDAADAIFEALAERGEAKFSVHPVALLGRADQPEAFTKFSRQEIEEAARLLERLGMLPLA